MKDRMNCLFQLLLLAQNWLQFVAAVLEIVDLNRIQ